MFTFVQAEEEKPDVMQVLFLKLGIKALSNEIITTKEQSSTNSIKLETIEKRLDTIEKNMEILLQFVNSKEVIKNNEENVFNKDVQVENNDSETLYTIQLFTAKKQKSIDNFFNQLQPYFQKQIKVYSINNFLVMRFGAEKLKQNLYESVSKLKDSGLKDIFIVQISQKSWSNAATLEN